MSNSDVSKRQIPMSKDGRSQLTISGKLCMIDELLGNINMGYFNSNIIWLIIMFHVRYKMKLNESGFRPPLCTYRLNWARRTSWGWRDDWDDTVLQTQDSKFEPWRSEAEHATFRSRRLPTILTFTRGWGRNNFVSFKPPRPGTEPNPDSGVKGSSANHYPRAPALMSR